jgi:hypothetical protein
MIPSISVVKFASCMERPGLSQPMAAVAGFNTHSWHHYYEQYFDQLLLIRLETIRYKYVCLQLLQHCVEG